MVKTKINYGIDLGTTNSAIARMENGEPKIIKSDVQKDITPSCVSVNKKGAILVGDWAFRAYRREKQLTLQRDNYINSFIEFKRTMGTNKKYYSTNADRYFTSEELSAEVLKKLLSFVNDDIVTSAVITIPAAFRMNQIDATRRAAKLAGLEYVEMLQEPIAAAMAYGLTNDSKCGYWLVFDFGGGTFDSALIKVEEGIIKVVDSEGDNHLGGKNLDYAIVDKILLPYIKENYDIKNILSDHNKKVRYRNALKFWAEDIKNQLSFEDEYNLYIDPGDVGQDDCGKDIEIDISINRSQLKEVLSPIIQQAIVLTKNLLKRNNLRGSDIDELILVGGPTLSPILREMVAEQIKEPNTSIDPMTVVARGAALFASTVDVPENLQNKSRDKSKIQLELTYEATSVELEEFVTLRLLPEKTEGVLPKKILCEIKRDDGAWSSGRFEINDLGEVIDVQLAEGKTNVFLIRLYDDKGNLLFCEPDNFVIIQGTKVGSSVLPYNIGIEVKDKTTGKIVFKTIRGLEKNKPLPATGICSELKTQQQIRPGISSDFIKIPIYQGEYASEGTRAIYNEHVYDVIISGNDLPSLLPENSEVELTIKIDRSQNITVEAFFPYLEYSTEISIPQDKVQSVETTWLSNEIKKATISIKELVKGDNIDKEKVQDLLSEIESIKRQFERDKNDVDNKVGVLNKLRRLLKEVDRIGDKVEWLDLEKKLKEIFYNLERINEEKGNVNTEQIINKLRIDVEKVIREKDKKLALQLIEDMENLSFEMERLEYLIGFVLWLDLEFNNINWADRNLARMTINKAKSIIFEKPSINSLQPLVNELYYNGGFDKDKPVSGGIDDSLLIG